MIDNIRKLLDIADKFISSFDKFIPLQNMAGLQSYLLVGLIIFLIGLYGAITRRSAIGILLGIELMLNAANINLVAFSSFLDSAGLHGQVFAIFVITIAACETAVGLALILAIYRHIKTVQVEKMNIMKW